MQVYRLIKEWTAWDIARRVAFAFFGIFQGTEENPEFLKGGTEILNSAFFSGHERAWCVLCRIELQSSSAGN